MNPASSRRSFLRYSGIGLAGLIAGCQTPTQRTSVPIIVDNRDTTTHDVQIEITGTEEAFNRQVSVDGGALVTVTDVASDDFCLGVDVLDLDEGVLEDCPSAGDSDYSASGTAVIITSEPNERGQQWVIEPIKNADMSDN